MRPPPSGARRSLPHSTGGTRGSRGGCPPSGWGGPQVVEKAEGGRVVDPQSTAELVDVPLPQPDELLVGAGEDLGGSGEVGVTEVAAVVVAGAAGPVRRQP